MSDSHFDRGSALSENAVENLIIIGSGPAGHTAALYASRAEMRPLMLEGFMAGGVAAGGQLTTTTDLENFPGFPDTITGPELMDRMRRQSLKFGTRIETETVESVKLKSDVKEIITAEGKFYKGHSVIIATGATARRLHIEGEDELWQKGISACAVCDGALPMFRDAPLVVIGGGDAACEESSFLTKFGSEIHLLVRRDVLRASKAMQRRVLDNQKIIIHWNTNAIAAIATEPNSFGHRFLDRVQIKNNKTGELGEIPAKGLFYAVGHIPNTAFLDGQLETDDAGYLLTKVRSTATDIPGVFACGDVQDHVYRQAVSAAGTGCMAALDAERYLRERGIGE